MGVDRAYTDLEEYFSPRKDPRSTKWWLVRVVPATMLISTAVLNGLMYLDLKDLKDENATLRADCDSLLIEHEALGVCTTRFWSITEIFCGLHGTPAAV